jgi:hypothetical protein
LQCVLAAKILTVYFVVCTLVVKKKSGQVSTCRIGPFPCELNWHLCHVCDVKAYSLPCRDSTERTELMLNPSSFLDTLHVALSKLHV